jgi:hypothetical protein
LDKVTKLQTLTLQNGWKCCFRGFNFQNLHRGTSSDPPSQWRVVSSAPHSRLLILFKMPTMLQILLGTLLGYFKHNLSYAAANIYSIFQNLSLYTQPFCSLFHLYSWNIAYVYPIYTLLRISRVDSNIHLPSRQVSP